MRLAVALIALTVLHLDATRLPIRTYTTADGLARDHILCIVQDPSGFLWFCTSEGLSRFDGSQFTNYDTRHGLPQNYVTSFLATRNGLFWLGTMGGVGRFDPNSAGPLRFQRFPLGPENKVPLLLLEDRVGGVWCGSTGGIFFLAPGQASFRHIDLQVADSAITALLFDRNGSLWVGTASGLYRRDPNGITRAFTKLDGLPNTFIMALAEDLEGRLWIGTRVGLTRIDGTQSGVRVYTATDGLPSARVESLLVTSDGTLWVGTAEGLAEWTPKSPLGGHEFQGYSAEQGLNARSVGPLAEDRDGNLWIGTFGSGVMKLARHGFTTYTKADGVPWVSSIAESRQGQMCLLFRGKDGASIGRFSGGRVLRTRPAWPRRITYFGWGRGNALLQDSGGEWWVATGQGLCRFARQDRVEGLAGATPKAIYTTRDGLPGDDIYSVFADSQNRIWIGTIGPRNEDGLAVLDRRSGRIHAFSQADGLPEKPVPMTFAEDRAGNIWLALFHGGLARYRHRRFTLYSARQGITGVALSLVLDGVGRLWVGTTSGLIHIDDPTRESPRFDLYDRAHGLSSDEVHAVTEDRRGRIYAATGRGIDRIDPDSRGPGRVQHYTNADGVAPGELDLAFRDHQGSLWFSTALGLSQFVPSPDRTPSPPPVFITGLNVGGVSQTVSELGQSALSGLRFPQNPLRVDFVGLGFLPGGTLEYQYMLEGADSGWSAPTDQRSVIYARLAEGDYRFFVRAVQPNGDVSPQPATVAFAIVPPMWRRWWFMLGDGAVASLLAYSLYRYRITHLLAVANIRARIATDLHDDIGASLSQIAVLSEVAQRGADAGPRGNAPLSEIARISRELVDSMSDIVWAINPEHDRLSNLVHRMRRFATDLFQTQGVALQFRSTVADHDLRIDADCRRQIYLIFKEGVNNIARHSSATRVEVELDCKSDQLLLCLHDNGRGFDIRAESNGNGMRNIRKRARALRARAEWQSTADVGTTLRIAVSLAPPKALAILRGRFRRHFR